ncbi:MAG: DoxX family protein [Chitinophagaceae bacterium]
MGTIQHIHNWSLAHQPRWLVALRVALGLCLFIKGISFMANATELEQLVSSSPLSATSSWIAIGITWAHMLGGALIIIGLFTRIAAIIQLPILLGAIFFINLQGGINVSELLLSIIVFLLLLLFVVEGSGPISVDHYFKTNPSWKGKR